MEKGEQSVRRGKIDSTEDEEEPKGFIFFFTMKVFLRKIFPATHDSRELRRIFQFISR